MYKEKLQMIKQTVRTKVDEICKRPYDEITQMIEREPFTSIEVDNGKENQIEIIATWDDTKEGVIRIAGYVGGDSKHWWQGFFSYSIYERLVTK